MRKLLLNLVSVGTTTDSAIIVGRQPFDKDELARLRHNQLGDYFFKRGGEEGDSIHSVALKPDLPPIGKETEAQQLGELRQGLTRIRGVHDAIVLPRPSKMSRTYEAGKADQARTKGKPCAG
jgi:hypothetical protein